jgi:hypothetical protein
MRHRIAADVLGMTANVTAYVTGGVVYVATIKVGRSGLTVASGEI